MGSEQEDVQIRVMPSGDGNWYWEVITSGNSVVGRGVADAQPAAYEEAATVARKVELIT